MTLTPEAEEVIRFLRRFSDLMSNKYNADLLLRAAALTETPVDRASQTEGFLRAEKSAARASLEIEVAEFNAKIADQRLKPKGRVSDTHVIVPISTLRLAETQFKSFDERS
jgi:hypothetical protein